MSVGTWAYFLPDQLAPICGKGRSWERSQSVVQIGLLVKPYHLVINCPYLISCCWTLRTRKGSSHYGAQCCDISKLYIGVVFKILVCVPKLLKHVKMNGRQLRVRFTKGISLSGKIKNTEKKIFPEISLGSFRTAFRWCCEMDSMPEMPPGFLSQFWKMTAARCIRPNYRLYFHCLSEAFLYSLCKTLKLGQASLLRG